MQLSRVIGNAVCTMKYPGLEGLKLLIVQPLNKNLQPSAPIQVAADTIGAGFGQLCVMVRSREAAQALPYRQDIPIDLTIIGLVDEYNLTTFSLDNMSLQEGYTNFT